MSEKHRLDYFPINPYLELDLRIKPRSPARRGELLTTSPLIGGNSPRRC